MTVWDKIAELAKDILGDNAPVPTDFSALEKAIIPEQGRRLTTLRCSPIMSYVFMYMYGIKEWKA